MLFDSKSNDSSVFVLESKNGEMYPRQWKDMDTTHVKDAERFRVVQFNVLADGLGVNGGFVYCNDEQLAWGNRADRLAELILAKDPQIIALQEVDHYDDFFEPLFVGLGYKGVFVAKENSPNVQFNGRADGCAIFVKEIDFNIKNIVTDSLYTRDASGNNLHRANQVLIAVHLEHKFSSMPLIVATSHLTASKTEEGEILRLDQMKQITDILDALRRDVGDTIPIVFCADMNAHPEPEPYPALVYEFMTEENPLNVKSVYRDEDTKKEPPFTTFKYRDELIKVAHTIDYIFYSQEDGLRCMRRLTLPTEEDIGVHGLPTWEHPSDHLYLAAESDGNGEKVVLKKKARAKYASLLASMKNDDADSDEDMEGKEIVFRGGLQKAGVDLLKKSSEKQENADASSWDKHLQKQKEKKKARKAAKKEFTKDGADSGSERSLGEDEMNDPFFADAYGSDIDMKDEDNDNSNKKKNTKKNKKEREEQTQEDKEADEKQKAQLELMMMDETAEQEKGFSLNELLRAEKNKDKKKKKKGGKAPTYAEDDFKVDTADSRFTKMFESAEYAIDPTDSNFKATAGGKAMLEETRHRQKRQLEALEQQTAANKKRRRQGDIDTQSNESTNNNNTNISSLVASIKRKTKVNKKK